MAILVDNETRLVVQGITGREGRFHTGRMVESGTNVVAGVTPGKGGQEYEGVPVLDMMKVANYLRVKDATLIGPNCPGVLSPGKANASIMPNSIFTPGNVGVVSRSGTLTYQIVNELTQRNIGQSTAVGIGGDPIIGTDFIEILQKFEDDAETGCVVMIGEIGGNAEQNAAEYVQSEMTKPVVAYIAGFTAPEGKTMGHAGAIVSGGESTAEAKSEALREAGIRAATNPSEDAELVAEALDGTS